MTGDQKQVALSICRRLGLPSSSCLTGPELESLSENELPIAVERTHIFAELSPRQKAHAGKNLTGKRPYSRLSGRWHE